MTIYPNWDLIKKAELYIEVWAEKNGYKFTFEEYRFRTNGYRGMQNDIQLTMNVWPEGYFVSFYIGSDTHEVLYFVNKLDQTGQFEKKLLKGENLFIEDALKEVDEVLCKDRLQKR